MDIGLGAFIRFANASQRARERLARKIAEESQDEYNPAMDYWRPMRQAIARDRKTSRDGAALRQAALAAPAVRRPNFEAISERWEDIAARWSDAHHTGSKGSVVEVGGTRVRISPLFAEEWNDGHDERVYVWFNKEELKPETVQAVQHLLSIGNGSAAHEARVFVDMRRASIAPATSFAEGIDLWLDELGDEFRHLTER